MRHTLACIFVSSCLQWFHLYSGLPIHGQTKSHNLSVKLTFATLNLQCHALSIKLTFATLTLHCHALSVKLTFATITLQCHALSVKLTFTTLTLQCHAPLFYFINIFYFIFAERDPA